MIDQSAREQLEAGGSRWSALASLGGFLACGLVCYLVVQSIGLEQVQALVTSAGPLAPIVYVLLKAVTLVITPLTGSPLRLMAGVLFGYWEGVALSVLGGVLGGSINFWIARRFGRDVVTRLLGARTLARVEPMLDKLGNWKALALARMFVAPLWDVLSYAVGLTRLRYRTYLIVASIGELFSSMILVGVGTSVVEIGVLETGAVGAVSAQTLLPTLALLVGIGIVALAIVGVASLLRPRVMRMLTRPEAGTAADGANQRPHRQRRTLGLSRSKRGAQEVA